LDHLPGLRQVPPAASPRRRGPPRHGHPLSGDVRPFLVTQKCDGTNTRGDPLGMS